MALNDAYPFVHGIAVFTEAHNFNATDTIKCALITNAWTPTKGATHPCWGAGGSTNVSTYEVSAGGNYTAGGATCANVSVTENGDYSEIDFDNPVAWAQDPSNPTNARWAIFYNDSAPNKECIGFYDLGGVHDMSGGETSIGIGAPFMRFT